MINTPHIKDLSGVTLPYFISQLPVSHVVLVVSQFGLTQVSLNHIMLPECVTLHMAFPFFKK